MEDLFQPRGDNRDAKPCPSGTGCFRSRNFTRGRNQVTDITTTYMGLPLRSPLVASASPLSDSIDNIRRFEDSGVGAVVLPSLFEEQLELESYAVHADLSRGAESTPESLNYFPNLHNYNLGPDAYLELIHKAKQSVS